VKKASRALLGGKKRKRASLSRGERGKKEMDGEIWFDFFEGGGALSSKVGRKKKKREQKLSKRKRRGRSI